MLRSQVLAVSDVSTALYNENGLDVKALKAHAALGKPLSEFQGRVPSRVVHCKWPR